MERPLNFISDNLPLFGFGTTASGNVQTVRELIENALDSRPTNLNVSVGSAFLTVEDNGNGVKDISLLTSVFHSTKTRRVGEVGGSGENSLQSSLDVGRYGCGLKAAMVFACRSGLQFPLFLASSSSSGRFWAGQFGVDGVKSLSELEKPESALQGTFAQMSLSMSYPCPEMVAELFSYIQKLFLLPRPNLTIRFTIPLKTLERLLLKQLPGSPVPSSMPFHNSSLDIYRALSGGGVTATTGVVDPNVLCLSSAVFSESALSGKEAIKAHLASAFGIPLHYVAHSQRGAVTVWVAMTPLTAQPSTSGVGKREMTAPILSRPIHILRFANGVPLLRNGRICSLRKGFEGVDWAEEFCLALSQPAPLVNPNPRSIHLKKLKATLTLHPAVPWHPSLLMCLEGGNFLRLSDDTALLDSQELYLATSSVLNAPMPHFSSLHVLLNAEGGVKGALSFGDLSKTFLQGTPTERDATDAVRDSFQALRACEPQLFQSKEDLQKKILTKCYLPCIAEQLAGIVFDPIKSAVQDSDFMGKIKTCVAGSIAGRGVEFSYKSFRELLERELDSLWSLSSDQPSNSAGTPTDEWWT